MDVSKIEGFSLLETLIAMLLSGILIMGIMHLISALQQQNRQLQVQIQLQEEMDQMAMVLEKAIRRSGYCYGDCQGKALLWTELPYPCLILKWDENSNGHWEGPDYLESEWYGYRVRNRSLEMRRGAENCDGGGWERYSNWQFMDLMELKFTLDKRIATLKLTGRTVVSPQKRLTVSLNIKGMNLP